MTISKVIDIMHRYNHDNEETTADIIRYINELDRKIWLEIFLTHEGVHPGAEFDGYTAADLDRELLVPAPYDMIYTAYCRFRFDEEHFDTVGQKASENQFLQAYYTFANHYNETHKPLQRNRIHYRGFHV